MPARARLYLMTKGIVEFLEVIDVNLEKCDRMAVANSAP